MIQLNWLFGLVEGVLVPVDLGQYGTELHLQLWYDIQFPHAVTDWFLF